MYIYLIVNHITGKLYIGQHKGNNLKKYLQQKFGQSRYELKRKGHGSGSYLFNSMRKHPNQSDWSIHPIFSGIEIRAELDQLEKDLIKALRATDPEIGYNICRGGEGFTGPHRPESKAKVTEALKLRWAQPGFKEHWNEIMTGHPVSEDTIEKIKTKRATQDEALRIEGCRKYANEHKDEMSTRMSREVHVLGGKAGSREDKQRAGRIAAKSLPKAIHIRWHVNRGKTNSECALCNP